MYNHFLFVITPKIPSFILIKTMYNLRHSRHSDAFRLARKPLFTSRFVKSKVLKALSAIGDLFYHLRKIRITKEHKDIARRAVSDKS